MTTPTTIDTFQSELRQIVDFVFQTMLQLEVTPLTADWQPATDPITAAIFIANAWKGAVVIECSRQLAFEVTARLMSVERPTTVNDDVRDSMGELANMIGGNFKSVLPAGTGLSMPSVVEGSNYSHRICGANRVYHQAFTCSEELL